MALTVLKSAALYFGMVFGAGFVFGVIRTLWVVPLVGVMWAELSLVLGLRDMSLDEYFASRDPISGTVYLLMLIAFALMPLVAAAKGERVWENPI